MTSLPFIFLLCFLSAEAARSKYPPKAAISSPVFGPRQVYGLIDGSVTVKCFYPPTKVNRHDRKYWCRESSRNCLTVVSSNGYMSPSYRGRASISDYPEQGVMVVNISQLVLSDRGTYQCGVGLNGRGLSYKVSLDISEGPNVPEEAELFYVELHGSVTMTCSFGVDTVSMRKYLCKMEKNVCNNIIDTYGKIDEDFTGRALLSNENNDGAFSIMITQVNWEDAGLYVCGVGSYGEYGETKELDLHVYEGSNVPQGKSTVTGVKGGSVTIECHYDPAKNYSLKYLCKWRKNGCPRIIENTGFVSDAYEGRVAMFDNPQNGTFSVVLNQLRDNDKGYYWCMTNDERERKSSKELKVVEGEPGLKGKEDVLAEAGSRVDLTCSYPCKYYSYEKYWCKWSSDGCSPLSASDQSQPGVDVSCDTANKTLVLTFDSVTSADQGWYWCGVKRNGHYGETLAVYLQVAGGDAEKVAELSPELLNLDTLRNAVAPSDAVAPSNAAAPSNAVAPGDAAARSNAAAPSDAAAPSNAEAPSNAVAPGGAEAPSNAVAPGGAEAPSNAVAPSNAEAPSNAAAPSSADRGVVPQGRAFSDAGVQNAAASESSEQGSGSNALTVALASSGAAVVVLGAAFAVFKYRQLKRSDLVSVGSYRTNISMSDFESVKEYGANDNACMKASQETQLGGDEFITTTASVESAAETKKAKRSSKEDADLAYSTYLLTSNAIAQGCAPGDSAAPAAAPQAWDGQV